MLIRFVGECSTRKERNSRFLNSSSFRNDIDIEGCTSVTRKHALDDDERYFITRDDQLLSYLSDKRQGSRGVKLQSIIPLIAFFWPPFYS